MKVRGQLMMLFRRAIWVFLIALSVSSVAAHASERHGRDRSSLGLSTPRDRDPGDRAPRPYAYRPYVEKPYVYRPRADNFKFPNWPRANCLTDPPTPTPGHPPRRCAAARAAFMRANPCPSTNLPKGRCPGYIIHRIVSLKRGGVDQPSNMRWRARRRPRRDLN